MGSCYGGCNERGFGKGGCEKVGLVGVEVRDRG